jgi:soluble lytic murein transglycosylase-like protein
MQLMPATAKRFGCSKPYDAESNIDAGTKYLSWLLKRFSGNVQLTLAGYNAGEGSVDKYDGIPPYNETQNYVRIITERYGKMYHPVLSPDDATLAFHLRAED